MPAKNGTKKKLGSRKTASTTTGAESRETKASAPKKNKRGGFKGQKGFTIKVPKKFVGHEPRLEFHAPPRKDIEDDVLEPEDGLAKHKFPPPRKNPTFRRMWGLFIDSVVSRDNFNPGHLETLRVLCDLYAEYDQLQEYVRKNGMSYCSVGRQGEVWKLYPEVGQLNRVKDSLRHYSQMLDLVLDKDKNEGGSDSESEDWA